MLTFWGSGFSRRSVILSTRLSMALITEDLIYKMNILLIAIRYDYHEKFSRLFESGTSMVGAKEAEGLRARASAEFGQKNVKKNAEESQFVRKIRICGITNAGFDTFHSAPPPCAMKSGFEHVIRHRIVVNCISSASMNVQPHFSTLKTFKMNHTFMTLWMSKGSDRLAIHPVDYRSCLLLYDLTLQYSLTLHSRFALDWQ